MKLNITNLTNLIKTLKKSDMDSSGEPLELTVGYNPKTGEWSYQTGDNSYTGPVYRFPVWGVTTIFPRFCSRTLAESVLGQIKDQSSFYVQG